MKVLVHLFIIFFIVIERLSLTFEEEIKLLSLTIHRRNLNINQQQEQTLGKSRKVHKERRSRRDGEVVRHTERENQILQRQKTDIFQFRLPSTKQSLTNYPNTKTEAEPIPFGVEAQELINTSPVKIKNLPDTTLRCEFNEGNGYNISSRISVQVLPLENTSFKPTDVCVYDFQNNCHTKLYLNIATNVNHMCIFYMEEMIVTKLGALIEATSPKRPVSFGHTTMVGGKNPQYASIMPYRFLKGHEMAYLDFVNNPVRMNEKDILEEILVPLRSRFDDCFNHQSFQSLPLIAMVYEFHSALFPSVYWHASKDTAALLMLLNVPLEKIIIERNVRARKLLLPWVPYWNPIQLPTLFSITGRIEENITQNLLSMSFSLNETREVDQLKVLDHRYRIIGFASNMTLSHEKKYFVYLSRPESIRRGVVNESDLLQALVDWLSPNYQLLVLPSTKSMKKIRAMYIIWQQYARIISRASVLAGPHGGALNNMIWAPRNCELIEFNELPKENSYLESHNQVPVRFPFLAGWWAKGGGKYWNIEASMKHPLNFYEGKMKVNVREWLEVLKQVNGGNLLRKEEIDWNRYSFEPHGCFPDDKKTKFSHC